jgi:hypothetical protein
MNMVNNPPPVGPSGPQDSSNLEHVRRSVPARGIKAEPMKFLGMYFDEKQAKQLWSVILKNVIDGLKKIFDKERKALKRLGPDGGDD